MSFYVDRVAPGERVTLANANLSRPRTTGSCFKEGASFENLKPGSNTCDYIRTGRLGDGMSAMSLSYYAIKGKRGNVGL